MQLLKVFLVLITCLSFGLSPAFLSAQPTSLKLKFLGKDSIPNIAIDGKPARVHTQGIFVTKESLYATGRLERPPKRALFFRFNRQNFEQFEYLDITPANSGNSEEEAAQDHPGGFDYDGQSFWIPVAVSKPSSSTTMIKIKTTLDKPFSAAMTEVAFRVNDHIGAIAVNKQSKLFYGANWDTKHVYTWDAEGNEQARIARDRLLPDQPNWALAVQDWKGLPDGLLLAGGYNKDPQRDKALSRAVLDLLDIRQRKLLDRVHLSDPDGGDVSLTHEGMARLNNELFFLPGDLGDNAFLYRYWLEILPEPVNAE